MSTRMADLICGRQTFTVPLHALINSCDLYDREPSRSARPYSVTSRVSPEVFSEFVSAIQSEDIFPTTETVDELEALCYEFGFQKLHTRISKFRDSLSRGIYADCEARNSIASLKQLVHQQGLQLACAQKQITFGNDRITALEYQLKELLNQIARMQRTMELKERSEGEFKAIRSDISLLRISAVLDSQIAPFRSMPPIFRELSVYQWALLYRGTRDGFGAKDFHRMCDRHPGTLTVIQTPEGSVFGGFTPLEWSSPSRATLGADRSLKSFLFSLRNPMKTEPKIFQLKPEMKDSAIFCCATRGPTFGTKDLCVGDRADKKGVLSGYPNDCHGFGSVYNNNSGYDGATFLAGQSEFGVREIEVFGIMIVR